MHHSPEIHVPDPHSPYAAIFRVRKPPAEPVMPSGRLATRFESSSTRSKLEYENPDLTQPSVSSF